MDFMFSGIFFGATPEILATAAPRRVITTSRPASTSASRRLKFALALTTETRIMNYSNVVIYMTILTASDVYYPTRITAAGSATAQQRISIRKANRIYPVTSRPVPVIV
jgi:hypothetical protein